MLKLDENYSDYVDMDNPNYPLGAAKNASSSESYDGTPLLADFMNNIVGAFQAMYKKAYGSTDGVDGNADSVLQSQLADAIAKYSDDRLTNHADKRGFNAHGATVEATPGQIATRDNVGNLQVAAAVGAGDAVNKGYGDSKYYEGWAVCATAAADEEKIISDPVISQLNAGQKIVVKFENGNTFGTCVGTNSNQIADGPKLKLNNFTAYPIKVGGELAGEGFVQANDVHTFVFDGSFWNDLTADVIYQGETTEGKYSKKRNLLIEQILNSDGSKIKLNYPVPFSDTDYLIGFSSVDVGGSWWGYAYGLSVRNKSNGSSEIRKYYAAYNSFGDINVSCKLLLKGN